MVYSFLEYKKTDRQSFNFSEGAIMDFIVTTIGGLIGFFLYFYIIWLIIKSRRIREQEI